MFCAASILNPRSTHPAALLSLGVPVPGAALQLLLLSFPNPPPNISKVFYRFFSSSSPFPSPSSLSLLHSHPALPSIVVTSYSRVNGVVRQLCAHLHFKSFNVKIRLSRLPFPSFGKFSVQNESYLVYLESRSPHRRPPRHQCCRAGSRLCLVLYLFSLQPERIV